MHMDKTSLKMRAIENNTRITHLLDGYDGLKSKAKVQLHGGRVRKQNIMRRVATENQQIRNSDTRRDPKNFKMGGSNSRESKNMLITYNLNTKLNFGSIRHSASNKNFINSNYAPYASNIQSNMPKKSYLEKKVHTLGSENHSKTENELIKTKKIGLASNERKLQGPDKQALPLTKKEPQKECFHVCNDRNSSDQTVEFTKAHYMRTNKRELHFSESMQDKDILLSPRSVRERDVEFECIIGQGTFGKVYKGKLKSSNTPIAIKKVYQDPKYKNREVEIVKMLKGSYVMKVLGTFRTMENNQEYLNIVMDYYDMDLYSYIKTQGGSRYRHGLENFDIKVFSYQILRGLMMIHSLQICHRDIKPHNILVKGKRAVLCDFGSAKILTNEPNLSYICSRCYRAPELIFGSTKYGTAIDIWSVGCVILEMINGYPLFIGESSIDHLIEILKVLGTPSRQEVLDMNPEYNMKNYKFSKIKRKEWPKIFPNSDPLLLDLLSKVMVYSPNKRVSAAEALCHQYFDQIRQEDVCRQLEKEQGIKVLEFQEEQIENWQGLMGRLVPRWYAQK